MSEEWDQETLTQLINDGVEENLNLDYKAAGSLARSSGKKKEMTKDVSAMANSAGGAIIYGIAEDTVDRHLPGSLDPVSRTEFSKEWIEQVLSNIQPRIDDLVIHSIQLDSDEDDVVYVVEIPQSNTAHQAKDHRYYRRYNFQSVPMTDYEIRDVMSRGLHPRVEMRFALIAETVSVSSFPVGLGPSDRYEERYYLRSRAFNSGNALAQYISCFLDVPSSLLPEEEIEYYDQEEVDGAMYSSMSLQNTHRDVVGMKVPSVPEYGPSRFQPILPGLGFVLNKMRISQSPFKVDPGLELRWKVHSDNARPISGVTKLGDIEIIDERSSPDEAA